MVRKNEVFIEYEAQVSSRVSGVRDEFTLEVPIGIKV